jgi:excisionase family DNA binding protein
MQTTVAPPERLLDSPGEVAQKLGCSTRTVWTLIQRGDLESVRLGQLRKVPAEAVDQYVAKLRKAAQAASGDGDGA